MGKTKVDYLAVEREYVTGNDSIRALATRWGVSFSSMAEWSRKHEWDRHRSDYRHHVTDTAIERSAERHVVEKEEALEEAFTLLRGTLYEFGTQLRDGKIPMTVKDLTLVIMAMQSLLGQPTSRTEATILGVNITADARGLQLDVLRELERVARAKLVGGGMEITPQLRLEGPKPN